jgi:hypothetical protein
VRGRNDQGFELGLFIRPRAHSRRFVIDGQASRLAVIAFWDPYHIDSPTLYSGSIEGPGIIHWLAAAPEDSTHALKGSVIKASPCLRQTITRD